MWKRARDKEVGQVTPSSRILNKMERKTTYLRPQRVPKRVEYRQESPACFLNFYPPFPGGKREIFGSNKLLHFITYKMRYNKLCN
jgi:hypothetical protein